MSKSSYNVKDLYKEFNKMDGEFGVTKQGNGTVEHIYGTIRNYCPHNRRSDGIGTCYDYHEKATSGVINLVEKLIKYGLDYDKLAEYAILFLSYKLYQNPEYSGRKLNDIYTKNIETNKYYNNKIKDNGLTCKEIINRKKDLMNMNINEISKFNGLFSILCKLYNGINKSSLDCKNGSNDANEFVKNFKELNNDSNINGNTSYIKLLSTLSNDYDNFKIYFAEKCNDCNDLPTLPKVKTPPSKLIPALSVFSVIPVFLGIAYKYSLFGVDKLFQRQYLRKKLKKVKKKLKLNI
ncbi:CIR protein PIR protein [Plasmodium vinckei brucechwatti]|uniref:CIR protein PIR protein n=1 Tax=Plasmodium vinckei brucechwatti TaxID=119398 RepID=A0A6V7S8E0_PLAVN|nr:CIR protein PIR protein [Plasmodium vinckei brucechwatti]